MDIWYHLDMTLYASSTWVEIITWAKSRFGAGLLADATQYQHVATERLWVFTRAWSEDPNRAGHISGITASFKFRNPHHRTEFMLYWGHFPMVLSEFTSPAQNYE